MARLITVLLSRRGPLNVNFAALDCPEKEPLNVNFAALDYSQNQKIASHDSLGIFDQLTGELFVRIVLFVYGFPY